jgi:hypothetical protein
MDLIGNVIFEILKKNGKEEVYFEGILKIKWTDIVGKTIANESFPELLKNKILYVSCKNPAFKQEIFFLKKRIIERINNLLNKTIIKDIKVSIRRK